MIYFLKTATPAPPSEKNIKICSNKYIIVFLMTKTLKLSFVGVKIRVKSFGACTIDSQ